MAVGSVGRGRAQAESAGQKRPANSSNTHETSNRTQHTHPDTEAFLCSGRGGGGGERGMEGDREASGVLLFHPPLALIPSAPAVARLEFSLESWSA